MMEFISSHLTFLWLLLGACFIIAEAFIVPGIGFFFAGLGAFTLGGLLVFRILETSNFFLQIGYASLFTAIWVLLLWKPFKRYISSRKGKGYSNFIGEQAMVISTVLEKGQKGYVTYSGTTMSALLDPNADIDQLPKGSIAYITHISGTTVTVSPFPPNS